jgi:hypothetical protein
MTDDPAMPDTAPGAGAGAPGDAPDAASDATPAAVTHAAPRDAAAAPLDPRSNPFDAWLAEAPAAPASGLCPWCSARLDPPTLETCPSCGAHLRGGEPGEIPGLTVVDPEVAARRAPSTKPSGSAGVLAWLSGETDLVQAATAPPPAPARPGLPGASGAPLAPADPASLLGPPSPDAVAPPDPRLRREMRRLAAGGTQDDGAVAPDAAGPDADAGTADTATAGGPAPAGDPATADGDPADAATDGGRPAAPPAAG